jgi:uncharacterized membrane protein YgcG
MSRAKIAIAAMCLAVSLLPGCRSASRSQPYDTNTAVPKGDPAFPALTDSFIVDRTGLLSQKTINENDAICRALQRDGVAEVVVVVIKGVNHPMDWATHYGRWLKLGRSGLSTEGGNNGVVWLIRPDAADRVTISVGRGLPKFATVDYGKIIDDAKDYLNFNNFDRGVEVIVQGTDRRLRELYPKNPEGSR